MAITWLHISDFHFSDKGPYHQEDIVLRSLLTSVKRFREEGHIPDLIFATGDIANTGNAKEYDVATKFFDDLLDAAGLERDRLFIVPGNHDVNRRMDRGLARTFNTQYEVDEYFDPETPTPHLTIKFFAFSKWYNEYFKNVRSFPTNTTCSPVEIVTINKSRIAILLINSALFCINDNDYEKLFIGRRCLDVAKRQLVAADLTIALIHHPLDWLSSVERANIKAVLGTSVDLLLHGHYHEIAQESILSTNGMYLKLAAGAAYQSRQWPNTAMYATFNYNQVTIFPIRYEEIPREVWTLDTSIFLPPEYIGTFPIHDIKTKPLFRIVKVFIASPSDVAAERSIAVEVINEWNVRHSDEHHLRLESVIWESDAAPESGDRPQAIINKQILDTCDFAIGIFWTRIGTSTGLASGGAVEEVYRIMAMGKPVMLYFSNVSINRSVVDKKEEEKLNKFRDDIKKRALVAEYDSLEAFRGSLVNHLDMRVRRWFSQLDAAPPSNKLYADDAKRYQSTLIEELGYIRILAVRGIDSIKVNLTEETFVPLRLSYSYENGTINQKQDSLKKYHDLTLYPDESMNRAFRNSRMLLVIGEPGAGKTTLLKQYALLAIEQSSKLGFAAPQNVFYLPLRELVRNKVSNKYDSLPANLAQWALKYHQTFEDLLFLHWLDSGESLVLLDGLDEISNIEERKEVCTWIEREFIRFGKARFVVTSRATGYRKYEGIELEVFHVRVDVLDFTSQQRKRYLKNWFKTVFLREFPSVTGETKNWENIQIQKARKKAETIIAHLEENKTLSSLASIPVLLQIIAWLWKDSENLLDITATKILEKGELLEEKYYDLISSLKSKVTEDSKYFSLADESENNARDMLYEENYQEAKSLLQKTIEYDVLRKKRISDEFGFLEYELDSQKRKWIHSVWCILSERNIYCIAEIINDSANGENEIATPNEEIKKEITINDKKYSVESPQIKGKKLEIAVERIFRRFFDYNSENIIVEKVKRQLSGSQYGFDIGIEICAVKDSSVRCHIECKYYKKEITVEDIAAKFFAENTYKSSIDHWILISPLANISNELNLFLDKQKESNLFPFNIQIWCPATNVEEFFGIEPEAHNSIYSGSSGFNPINWSDEKRAQVMEKWMLKLNPPLIFPKGWSEYIRYPENLCIGTETPDLMDRSFACNILMYCRNANGDLLPQPLDYYVDQWLKSTVDKVCYLLGDFGDGKSFYTYVLARRLVNNWKSNQDTGWLPIRFSLKSFPDNCSSRDFLRNRLEEFGADISGWNEMKKKAINRIIILDGFDEMSVSLEQKQVNENIGKILQCINEEFQNCKILITSRPHFFKNRKDADRLLSRAKGALYYLASIDRKKVINHLCESIPIQNRSYVYHLDKMSDPIGIASKPLFLDMLKEVLFSLNEESSTNTLTDLNIITLYEKYIDKTLERKKELLDLPDLRITPSEIFDNLKELLGKIAEDMRKKKEDYVSLVNYISDTGENFAELLWKITSPEESNELLDDACSRIESRTFLSRVITGNDDEWRVKWCHRSMQEYFIASRLSRLIINVDDDYTELLGVFENIPFNYEIFEFAVEFLKQNDISLAKKRLLEVINKSNSRINIAGNAITLLLKLYSGSLSAIDFDWSGKRYDGAELENADLSNLVFTGSSFCYADMANVNLENTNLENCDFTGVRVEETTAVMSIWSDDNGEKLIVVYRDGIVRQWQPNPGSKTIFTTVYETRIQSECQFGIDADSMQAWLKVGDKYLFIDRQDNVWKIISQFQIKSIFTSIRIQKNILAYVEKNENNSLSLVVIDLNLRIAIYNKKIIDAQYVVTLDNKAVVYSNSILGVYLCAFIEDNNKKEQLLPFKKTSCLDVYE